MTLWNVLIPSTSGKRLDRWPHLDKFKERIADPGSDTR